MSGDITVTDLYHWTLAERGYASDPAQLRAVAVLAFTLALGAPALPVRGAEPEQDVAATRARVERERSDVETRYTQALQACAGSFALTACQDSARAQRRRAIERLDAEQSVLDDQQRRERASQRQQAIERRSAERASASASAASASAPATQRRRAPSPSPLFPAPAAQTDAASAAARREAQSLARQRQRQQQFEAHQTQVRQRQAEQDARHPPAAGLPTPVASGSR